jgi:DNA-binding FadR family transcriptional regulator
METHCGYIDNSSRLTNFHKTMLESQILPKKSTAVVDTLKDVFKDDIRLPKLSHLVASKLREQIVSGKLKQGSLLLPETQMLERFNVSRPTLREAMRILEAESLITIGRGMRHGAIVRGPTIEKAIEFTSFMLAADGVTMRDMHEARMFFEPAIIRSLEGDAAKNAAKELRECVNDMTKARKDKAYTVVIALTNRFHETLVKASGNKTMTLVCAILQSIADGAYNVVINDEGNASRALDRNMEKTTLGYSTLCDLIEKGKTNEAASFWRTYMERSLEFLERSELGSKQLIAHAGKGED